MSFNTQAKVLRALQEQRFTRVGGNKLMKVDVRVLAASNRVLEKEIEKGQFREDLYYRLNVRAVIDLSLQERRKMPRSAAPFHAHSCRGAGAAHQRGDARGDDRLSTVRMAWQYPGNAELTERLMIMLPGAVIDGPQATLSLQGRSSGTAINPVTQA